MQRNVLPTVLRADVVMPCLACQKEAACDYGLRCCFLFPDFVTQKTRIL